MWTGADVARVCAASGLSQQTCTNHWYRSYRSPMVRAGRSMVNRAAVSPGAMRIGVMPARFAAITSVVWFPTYQHRRGGTSRALAQAGSPAGLGLVVGVPPGVKTMYWSAKKEARPLRTNSIFCGSGSPLLTIPTASPRWRSNDRHSTAPMLAVTPMCRDRRVPAAISARSSGAGRPSPIRMALKMPSRPACLKNGSRLAWLSAKRVIRSSRQARWTGVTRTSDKAPTSRGRYVIDADGYRRVARPCSVPNVSTATDDLWTCGGSERIPA